MIFTNNFLGVLAENFFMKVFIPLERYLRLFPAGLPGVPSMHRIASKFLKPAPSSFADNGTARPDNHALFRDPTILSGLNAP